MDHIGLPRVRLWEAVRLAQNQDISDHWTATDCFSLAIAKLKQWVAVLTILHSWNIVRLVATQKLLRIISWYKSFKWRLDAGLLPVAIRSSLGFESSGYFLKVSCRILSLLHSSLLCSCCILSTSAYEYPALKSWSFSVRSIYIELCITHLNYIDY